MNQKRTCGIVTLVIMSLFSVIEAAAEDTNIEKGVSYLVPLRPSRAMNRDIVKAVSPMPLSAILTSLC